MRRTETTHSPCGCLPSRRQTLGFLLAGAAASTVAGCAADGSVPLFMMSQAEEQRLGVATWNRIRQETPASTDSKLQERLQDVGSRLVRASGGAPTSWEFVVFQGDAANAFALPGGKVGIYEGIFNYMENDAHLATVVGHEIGHNVARHAASRLSRVTAAQVGLMTAGVALDVAEVAQANEIAALLGVGVQFGVVLPYSRGQELEADDLGLDIMARGGFDPREATVFWRNMQSAPGDRPAEFLSTHPSPANRIANLEREIPGALSLYRPGTADTSFTGRLLAALA